MPLFSTGLSFQEDLKDFSLTMVFTRESDLVSYSRKFAALSRQSEQASDGARDGFRTNLLIQGADSSSFCLTCFFLLLDSAITASLKADYSNYTC